MKAISGRVLAQTVGILAKIFGHVLASALAVLVLSATTHAVNCCQCVPPSCTGGYVPCYDEPVICGSPLVSVPNAHCSNETPGVPRTPQAPATCIPDETATPTPPPPPTWEPTPTPTPEDLSQGPPPPPQGPPVGDECGYDGDPVNLATGLFVLRQTDLDLPDVLPITLTRTYRPNDTVSRAFGIGATHPYRMYLKAVDPPDPTEIDLILADGGRVRYVFDGTTYVYHGPTATTACAGAIGASVGYDGSTIAWNETHDEYELTLRDGTVYGFLQHAGWLTEIRDRFNNRITITREADNPESSYDENSDVVRITSPSGRWIHFLYDNHRIISADDNSGRVVTYQYENEYLVGVTGPLDGNLACADYLHPFPCCTGYQTGTCGTTTVDANQQCNGAYPGLSPYPCCTGLHSGTCNTTVYEYEANRLMKVHNRRGAIVVTNAYDGVGRVVRQAHADRGKFRFSYYVQNGTLRSTRVRNPVSLTRTVAFNDDGYMIQDSRRGGGTTQTIVYHRDPDDRVTDIIEAATGTVTRTTRFDYEPNGNLLDVKTIWDDSGSHEEATAMMTMTYDTAFNQLQSVAGPATSTNPLGNTVTFGYDSTGSFLTGFTDAMNRYTAIQMNGQGLLKKIIPPTTVSSTNPIETDPPTDLQYDGADLISLTKAGETTTRFVDAAGRVAAITDALGHRTEYEHDLLNRLTSITDPLGHTTRFVYDPDSNVTEVDTPTRTIFYQYDAMGRLTSRQEQVGSQTATESISYDRAGRVKRRIDRNREAFSYNYDGLSRLKSVLGTAGSSGGAMFRKYGYDGLNRLVSAGVQGNTSTWQYDDLHRKVTAVTTTGTISYEFDEAGLRTSMKVGNQPPIAYHYYADDQLSDVRGQVAITYDQAGRRSTLTLPNAITAAYGYDETGRLGSIDFGSDIGSVTYLYNAAGQREVIGGSLARASVPEPITVSGPADRIASTVAGSTYTPFTFDPNGNLTSDGSNKYQWDSFGQLGKITDRANNTLATFAYDALGRRVGKQVMNDPRGQISYLYDGANPIRESESNTLNTTDLLTGLGIDEYFTRTDTNGRESFITDALGSTLALVDANGSISTNYTYEPFGAATNDNPASPNEFQFTGRENDGTGLYYYRARYYHPVLQRFISEDPIGFAGGDTDLYGYVLNDPVNGVDPDGTFVVPPWVISGLTSAGVDLAWQVTVQGKSLRCVDWANVGIAGLEGAGLAALLAPGGLIGKSLNLAGQPGRETLRWLKIPDLLRWESHPISRAQPGWFKFPHIHLDAIPGIADWHLFFPDPPIIAGAATAAASSGGGCGCR